MRNFISRALFGATAIVLASTCSSSSIARAATDSVPVAVDAAHPKADSTTTIGTLRVERYGHGSPAMIFIPGLACGSWVWDDAVKTYGATHALYLVTLAGFDGLSAPAGPALDGADASLLALVTNEKLDRPIVIGHSLGGHLAIRFGEEHAALVRGIVSVDGTPVFPTVAQSSPEQRAQIAGTISESVASSTPEKYRSVQSATVATMVTDPENAKRVAALTARSDQQAVAAYTGDLIKADLRPQLATLTVPALEIVPVPTKPAPFEDASAATSPIADREKLYKGFYEALFPDAPKLTVVTIPDSKHFIMVDQPQALYDAISAFIATLGS